MSDELQDRLDAANKSRADAMALAAKRQSRIEALEAKLAKAVEALKGGRQTILELVNSRWCAVEGLPEEWVSEIDATLAEIKGESHD